MRTIRWWIVINEARPKLLLGFGRNLVYTECIAFLAPTLQLTPAPGPRAFRESKQQLAMQPRTTPAPGALNSIHLATSWHPLALFFQAKIASGCRKTPE
jgi:hypothetical protein